MATLEDLLKPKAPTFDRFILRLDGQPKTSKSTLAVTASAQVPPPAQWDAKKPVDVTDMLWITFEPNALMYPASRGINIKHQLDWSDESLSIADLEPAIKALPAMAEQYRAAGVRTVVVDTLTTFNRLLLRDIIDRPEYKADMERIRAYGRVDEKHYLLFDMLRAMKMNVIGIVHLQAFQPFGESDDARSATQVAMNKAAEKAVDKIQAGAIAGARSDFIPEMRPKPAGHWARLSDAVLVAKPRSVTVRASVSELKYEFVAQPTGEFSAGGRWDLGTVNDGFLRPHITKKYGNI